jgi:hypothetical protein
MQKLKIASKEQEKVLAEVKSRIEGGVPAEVPSEKTKKTDPDQKSLMEFA